MNSELKFVIGENGAKSLWSFLNSHEKELDTCLLSLLRRLESGLWDHLSIDDMNCINNPVEVVNE